MSDLISRKALIGILTKYKFGAIKSESEREYTKETVLNFVKEQSTVEAVPVVQLESVLKEAYLEIANGYSVSDLQSDSDKVACVASKFRQTVLDKLRTSAK